RRGRIAAARRIRCPAGRPPRLARQQSQRQPEPRRDASPRASGPGPPERTRPRSAGAALPAAPLDARNRLRARPDGTGRQDAPAPRPATAARPARRRLAGGPGMTFSVSQASQDRAAENGLAELVEELSAKIETGEAVDLSAYFAAHPAHADELRRLVPA